MSSKSSLGAFSALGTYVLMAIIAFKAGVFGAVINELGFLLTGNVQAVAINHTSFLMMFPIILATVVLALPCAIAAVILDGLILGKSGKHSTTEFFERSVEGNLFLAFFVLVLLEELFARWLFLGLLTKIPFLSGTVAFYVLFLLGNGIWARLHLKNFENEEDRKLLRVLPQFISGIFLTYVFVKYGLLASVLAHFAYNAVIFSIDKVKRFDRIDIAIIGYAFICVVVSYALMARPIADILPWFANSPTFRLQGWGFWDYVKISVFVTSSFVVVFGLLLYDKGGNTKPKSETETGAIMSVAAVFLAGLIIIGIYSSGYALLGLFIDNVPYRILTLAILLTFFEKGASGSAMCRVFWAHLPEIYVTVCILQALGFWPAVGWIMAEIVIISPRLALEKLDD